MTQTQSLTVTSLDHSRGFRMRTLLFLVMIAAATPTAISTMHKLNQLVTSSCKAIWLFTTPCAEVNATLIQQVRIFSPNAGCDVCTYLFVSGNNRTLTVDHSSSDGFQAETITFYFTPSATATGCQMFIQSESTGESTTKDDAVNYCNIYDLLTGSGLNLLPGFLDRTNKWTCAAFGLEPCNA